MPEVIDVLIAGAGPTGLTLAAELRRRSVHSTIVDRLAAGENTSRAAVIQAHTLEVLEPLGVTKALIDAGLKAHHVTIRERDEVLLSIDLSTLPSAYPFGLMCPQDMTEQILLARLRELGGDVVRPAEVGDIRIFESGAEVEVAQETISTRWLIGCDGMHSHVREAAGIDFTGAAYEQSFILADVQMTWPFPADEANLFLSPEGLVVVAPLPHARFRIVATVDDAPEHPTLADVQSLLDARGPQATHARIADCIWSTRFRVHHRLTASPRKGRVLLCGDAAHVHSPAGGQGMNIGIQDAMSLAEVLSAVLAGAPESRLDEWAARRHEVAEKVVTLTDRMTRVATVHSSLGRALRNHALVFAGHLPWLTDAFARTMAELEPDVTPARPQPSI